ncbi:hypothetical protein C8T65DRAFT_740144 [Cerioporus squamosus]|nr:hypothetical protein C8T65DRAFT_740144 [Cerioporus squamosus]
MARTNLDTDSESDHDMPLPCITDDEEETATVNDAEQTQPEERGDGNWEDEEEYCPNGFPSPFFFINRHPYTLVELRMRQFSGKIRLKPNWWQKVYDASIVAKWREEIIAQDRALVEKLWGGKERYKLGRGKKTKKWPRYPISKAQLDSSTRSLSAIQRPGSSRRQSVGVALLENVPDDEKDWHPGSNNQVLDLVHPSLYCLRIGESRFRPNAADEDSLEILTQEAYEERRPDAANLKQVWYKHSRYIMSRNYQWLPTDFAVSESGDVRPLAYINNLHPTRHAALYPPIASILGRFIPLFERVISDVLSREPPRAVKEDPYSWYDSQPEQPDWNDQKAYRAWERKHHWPRIPQPAPFTPPDTSKRVQYPLKGRKVQVIVKLANIVLTPENPRYPGGAWHAEGMANENIVATGLYYYACENITESRLDFRVTVDTSDGSNMRYQQDDNRGYTVAYGFGRDQHQVQEESCILRFMNYPPQSLPHVLSHSLTMAIVGKSLWEL